MLMKSLRYLVLLIVVSVLVSGCGQAQQAPTPSGKTAAPATKAADASSKEAAPVGAAKTGAAAVNTDQAAAFFKGKTISFIVPSRAGGSYDMVGRLLAEYIGKYTGANVVIKNIEGGGGIQGTNAIYAAKPDGLTIGLINIGMIQPQALGGAGVQYDLSRLTWLGQSVTSGSAAVANANSQLKTVDDLLAAKNFKEGDAGAGSTGHLLSVLRAQAIGWNAQIITGFANTNEAMLSLVRGEIDMLSTSWDTIEPFVKSGDVVLVFSDAEGGIPGHPELKSLMEVPAVAQKLTPEGKELLELDTAIGGGRRIIAGPPGLAADVSAYLEDVLLKKVLTDPEFVRKATVEQSYVISPISASDLSAEMIKLVGIVEKHKSTIQKGLQEMQR